MRIPNCIQRPKDKMMKLYEESEENPTEQLTLASRLQSTERLVKSFIVLNFAAFMLGTTFMLIRFLITGRSDFMTPSFLPWIDKETTLGYLMNAPLQILLCLFAFLALTSHDANCFFYGCQTVVFVDILEIKLNALTELVTENAKLSNGDKFQHNYNYVNTKEVLDRIVQNDNKIPTVRGRGINIPTFNGDEIKRMTNDEIRKLLIKIIDDQLDYAEFVSYVADFIRSGAFAAIAFNSVSLCFWILQGFLGSYVKAVAGFMILFFQIFIPCTIGTLMAHQVGIESQIEKN